MKLTHCQEWQKIQRNINEINPLSRMAILHQVENIIIEGFTYIKMYGNFVVIRFKLNFSLGNIWSAI